MEAHGQPRGHRLDVADLEQKIALPGKSVVFAIGGDLEPSVLLEPNHIADRGLLDARKLRRSHSALFGGLARRNERIGTDQAADMVGAKWRLCTLHHGRP